MEHRRKLAWSLNMYVERSGFVEVAITLFTTTSTMRYLDRWGPGGQVIINFRQPLRESNEHVHAAPVELVGEGLEVVGRAELGVELGGIRDPVTVVGVAPESASTLPVLVNR